MLGAHIDFAGALLQLCLSLVEQRFAAVEANQVGLVARSIALDGFALRR